MNKPYTVIAEIAADNSKLHKEAVIRREAVANNIEFMAGLRFALDNNYTFGVKKVPTRSGSDGPGLSFQAFTALAWALIKRELSGHAALAAIEDAMDHATNDEWNGWYRLVLTRDFRAGFTESTVNKAVKGVNDKFVIPTNPYMRCSLPEDSNIEKWDWSEGMFSQIKADGMFANINLREDGALWITSRGNSLFPEGCLGMEDELVATLKKGTQTHGEFTVYENGKLLPRQVGNGILRKLVCGTPLKAGQRVVFDAWDQIPLSQAVPKGQVKTAYKERFAALQTQVGAANGQSVKLIETRIVHSQEEANEHFKDALSRKLEGTICKHPGAIWKDGTNKDQVKMKLEVEVELEVVGFTAGKGKLANLFGSMEMSSKCGKLRVDISGFPDDLRAEIHNNRDDWMGSICTVRSNSLMEPSKNNTLYSLFLPRFVERRYEKTEADDLNRIQAQFDAATNAKKLVK